jgi:hypothetical protein
VSESLPPPDGELAEALDALRREEAARPEVRARARSRLMAAVAAGTVAPVASGGFLAGKRAVATTAFVAGGVVGALAYSLWMPRPAPQVVYVDRVVAAPPPLVPVAPPPVAPAPVANVPATATATVSAPPSRASQLSAERLILDEARAAIAQGDPGRALDRLEKHRRTFPSPILGEERDAMGVEALAKAGRHDEAASKAAAFHKRWPESLFASAVDDAVGPVR